MENEMTLEQAKDNLQFQGEMIRRLSGEVGALSTEKISLVIAGERSKKRIEELEAALKQMVGASKGEGAE